MLGHRQEPLMIGDYCVTQHSVCCQGV